MSVTVMERARRCVATRPPAIDGQGGHATTFGVACLLVWGFGLTPEEAMPLMQEYNQTCMPPWGERDLWHKLRSAEQAVHPEPRGYMLDGQRVQKGEVAPVAPFALKPKRAKFDPAKLLAVQDPALGMPYSRWVAWLREKSPLDPRTVGAEAFLDALYEPGECVMIFENMRSTGDYMRWIGKGTFRLGKTPDVKAVPARLPEGTREGMNWLMQPVDGKWQAVPGKLTMSRRTKANVTRWPYLLLESDKADHALWLNALVRAQIRIVAIVASGGRSLHALVRLDKATEEEWKGEAYNENARMVLEILGTDSQAMHAMVYPRLPGTYREGKMYGARDEAGKPVLDATGRQVMKFEPFREGRRSQRLLYFNPTPSKGRSIAEGLTFEHSDA